MSSKANCRRGFIFKRKVKKVKVEVEKIQPPIDATFDKISVILEGEN